MSGVYQNKETRKEMQFDQKKIKSKYTNKVISYGSDFIWQYKTLKAKI